MSEIVRETSRFDEVRVASKGRSELAADLRALQRMRQPGAREIALRFCGPDDLSLRAEAS
jgi:hypothetical protein